MSEWSESQKEVAEGIDSKSGVKYGGRQSLQNDPILRGPSQQFGSVRRDCNCNESKETILYLLRLWVNQTMLNF